MIKYLATEESWRKTVDYIRKTRTPIGLDSEFVGVDFKSGQSCPSRARIHVWSIAVSDGVYNPRGFMEARGATLPKEAIPTFKDILEDPTIIKYAHNSPVDVHAFYNAGVDVQGVVNTLSLARWVYPSRLSQSLDSLATDYLGTGKIISYKELVSEPAMVEVTREVKYCACGVEGCRKRKGHEKFVRLVTEIVEKGVVEVPLDTIVPGHRKWDLLVEYAGQDAVMAFELGEYLTNVAARKYVEVPWLK